MAEERQQDEAKAVQGETQQPGPSGPDLGKTSTGLDPRLAAFLSYLLSIFLSVLSGLLFYVIEPNNKFVRFHALQSILFNAAVIVISVGLTIVSTILAFIPILGWIVAALAWIAFVIGAFVVWVILMVRSYQGEYYKLPYIGDWAEKNAEPVTH